jgi:two-component system response regulator FlrC
LPEPTVVLHDDLKRREYELILEALRAQDGNRTATARQLGISPRTLRYKLARMREDGHHANLANGPGT